MKTKIGMAFIILLSLALEGRAQLKDSTQYIKRVWRVADNSLKVAAESRLNKIKKENPAMANGLSVDMVVQMMKMTTLDFRADGSFKVISPQGEAEGDWKLLNGNKRLEYTTAAMGTQVRDVIRMMEGKLVLKLEDGTVVHYAPK